MDGFKISYCPNCQELTAHDIYLSEGGYLHSLCSDCGKDVSSESKFEKKSGEASKHCNKCGTKTEHIRYRSQGGYIHWFCVSCGKDISSDAKEI